MAAPLRFHFDFISPYGWFASREIDAIAAKHGREVDWHPMLLGVSVLKVMGLKPLLDTPVKGAYVRRDVLRHARKRGVALGRNLDGPMPSPLAMGRAFCWIRKHHPDVQGASAHAIYDAHWVRGLDLSSAEEIVREVSLPAAVDTGALLAAMATDEPATLLRESVQASLDAGVFGSPTLVVDGEPFWGLDRLGEVDEWLTRGGW
ncbi:2-hydroxychromene-2-carboxylate isomerase [Ramlibacter albus]|uniref:2-hydroxychromene-2-carboxylate isomerase n=1 Tax=Ramlibacter albus TaxID=2079448 RepID=A0A923MBE2_9BURK|nr:2-hydroxychromene-2-carboxylate isomerase [Ramlibacter albus]MBC5766269.1 2-hydroxychromene-2-carboxylate isomerase [Ramlibacter albus]